MSWFKDSRESRNKHAEAKDATVSKQRKHSVSVLLLSMMSALLFVVPSVVLSVVSPMKSLVDSASSSGSSIEHQVSATSLQTVCPSRISLPDLTKYGDSQFHETEGNIKAVARYGAFGDVYSAQVNGINSKDDQYTDLKTADADDYSSALFAESTVDNEAQILKGNLSEASSGTGIASAYASWATQGDMRGIAASTCSNPSMRSSFLIPESKTGVSIKLVVVNTSSKATVINVSAWSYEHGSQPVNLSTGSAFAVQAKSKVSFDVSAAISHSEGSYIQVVSDQTPVASYVDVIRSEGLSPKGIDVIKTLSPSSKTSIMPGVLAQDQTKLYIWPQKSGHASISWLTSSGVQKIKDIDVTSNKVQIVDLGVAPDNVNALTVDSNVDCYTMAQVSRDGSAGQSDVAYITAVRNQGNSVIVSPLSAAETTMYVASENNQNSSFAINAYNSRGELIASKRYDVAPNSVVEIKGNNINDKSVMYTLKSKDSLSWGARLNSRVLSDENIASVAWLSPHSLESQHMNIRVSNDPRIVH